MELNNNVQTQTNGDLVIEDLENLKLEKKGVFVSEQAENYLYDSQILNQINFDHLTCFKPPISPSNPGPNLKVRSLALSDYDKGFLKLLSQLTTVGDISRADFLKRFSAMKSCKDTYYVTVIEDTKKNEIIGAATLIKERKFIHHCASRGIIEEVVVSDEYRGKQLGKLIVATLIELGKQLDCYKITLNCNDKMVRFYTSLGFKAEDGNANFLMIRVPH